MKMLKLICLFLLALNLPAAALVINVPSQYSTIQSAINASSNGDTVLVQPGTYLENINFRGKKIVLTSRYYQANNYSFIQSTIINGSNPPNPDTASCVIMHNGEDSTTVLQGFTITGGKGTKWTDEQGAGLYREGGGILTALCNPVIQHNIITGNQAIGGGVFSTGGGGMRLGNGYIRVFNNIITNNTAFYGAGIVLNHAGGEYRNNIIYKNYGSQQFGAGSGMWLNGNSLRPKFIENNTIVFNTAIFENPGVYSSGVSATFINNIVWGNSGGLNTQVSGASIIVRYCDVQGGYAGGGNINIYPQFDTTNYYIASNSPCIDKGDSSAIYNDPADPVNPTLAKWPARGLLRNDLGAYGGPGSKVIANSIVAINSEENITGVIDFHLNQNYPNPFNPVTKINYELRITNYVSLNVYGILGNEITKLVSEKQNAGRYEVDFDGSNFSSGVYFYKLQTDNFSETKKMTLIR
ncbi:MAG: T9SS type A sorting domain-containing protein [Bacteroidota bacterium]|nr:T9SS type A sorting domain-containing protein [Bacteroidota bacterium]